MGYYTNNGAKCERCKTRKITRILDVVYGRKFNGSADYDTLRLCEDCARTVRADAHNHGYTVQEEAVQ